MPDQGQPRPPARTEQVVRRPTREPARRDERAAGQFADGVEVQKVQKRLIEQIKIQVEDIIVPLATALKEAGQTPEKVFKAFDADGNAMMSADELQPILKQYLGLQLTDSELLLMKQAFKERYKIY